MSLKSETQQNIQTELSFSSTSAGEAREAGREETESLPTMHDPEGPPARIDGWRKICERENLKEALRRVKANQGSAGVGRTDVAQHAMLDACFEYDDRLRANGHFAKEELGGILVLDARDLNHAIQLMSRHPSLKYGTLFDIRPVGDMSEIMQKSEQRRRKLAAR
jgi:hypothetical protein